MKILSRIFNKGLYTEGLKQSTLTGVIFTSIMMIGAVLIPISSIVNVIEMRRYDDFYEMTIISGLALNPLLFVAMVLFAPLIILTQFHFLNKRNSSDFYHSLPHRRETVIFSYFLSSLTWIIFSILACTLVSVLICLAGSAYVSVNFVSLAAFLFNITAACILVMSVTLLAMTITGTTFSNIITALLILFLPRLIITLFTFTVSEITRIMPLDAFGFFGNVHLNIPFGLAAFVVSFSDYDKLIYGSAAGIYTIVLGLIYLGIAVFANKVRKSEMAGTSAPNKYIQSAIRVAVSFVICIIGCMVIVNSINNNSLSTNVFIGLFMIYGFALIVYFSYELITTKKLVGIIKAAPALLVLAVLNIAFIGGVFVVKEAVLNIEIKAENVNYASIVLAQNDSYYYSMPYQEASNYETLKMEKIKIRDTEIHKILTESLKRSQEIVKESYQASYQYNSSNPNYINVDSSPHQYITLKLNSGQTVRRYIWMSEDEGNSIASLLKNDEEYRNAFLELPKDPVIVSVWNFTVSDESTKEIYEIFRNEVKELDFLEWYGIMNSMRGYPYDIKEPNGSIATFFVSGKYGIKTYRSEYPITNKTPGTLAAIMEKVNEENASKIDETFSDIQRIYSEKIGSKEMYDKNIDFSINISTYKFKESENGTVLTDNYSSYYDSYSMPGGFLDLLESEVKSNREATVKTNELFYYISINGYDYDYDTNVQIYFFFNADESLLDIMRGAYGYSYS